MTGTVRRLIALRCAVVVAVVIAAACAGPRIVPADPPATHRLVPATPRPLPTRDRHTLTGSVTLPRGAFATTGGANECTGSGGYSDISVGADVSVRDVSGVIIANTRLSPGRLDDRSRTCTFTLTVTVPDTRQYQLEVSGRSLATYSREELSAEAWAFTLRLGE
jgi:hypothetical protein